MSDNWSALSKMIFEYVWADPKHAAERLDEVLDIIKEENREIYLKVLKKLEEGMEEE